jgi:predicted Zn-dependent protease
MRVVLVAVALAVCAWFALGIRQANQVNDAAAIVGRPASAAQARHAAKLLDDARTLNPDARVDVLRGQLALQQGNRDRAHRILSHVVAREPQNLEASVSLARASRTAAEFRGALAHVAQLVPRVPPPH